MAEKAGYIIRNAAELGMLTQDPSSPKTVFIKAQTDIFPGDIIDIKIPKGTYRLRVDMVYLIPPITTSLGIVFGVECRLQEFLPRARHGE